MNETATPDLTAVDPARTLVLREWAVIYDAVLEGRQILDLRKGGIHEVDRHFEIRAPRFWLYPSFVHQRADLLRPEHRRALERVVAARPPQEVIRIFGWADLVATAELSEPAELDTLAEEVIWTRDYAAKRLEWKPKHPLHMLVLRAHRLHAPVEIPWREEYRGCTSWGDLSGLPPDPSALASTPALTDDDFAARLASISERVALRRLAAV